MWMSVAVVITGLTVVSFASLNESGADEEEQVAIENHSAVIVGVIAMIWGQFFHGSQGVLEEYILKNSGGQEPLYMMGWEGVWGFMMTMMLLIPAQLYPCPLNES